MTEDDVYNFDLTYYPLFVIFKTILKIRIYSKFPGRRQCEKYIFSRDNMCQRAKFVSFDERYG